MRQSTSNNKVWSSTKDQCGHARLLLCREAEQDFLDLQPGKLLRGDAWGGRGDDESRETWSRRGRYLDLYPLNIIDFLAGPTSPYRVPYPETYAKLHFRDSEEDIDRQKPILRYPPQSVFIVGDSGSVEPAGITLVSWKAIPSRSSLTNIAGERKGGLSSSV